jgi:hypothetical protein
MQGRGIVVILLISESRWFMRNGRRNDELALEQLTEVIVGADGSATVTGQEHMGIAQGVQ